MAIKVFQKDHDANSKGEDNFNYLIKIINLTPFVLEYSKLVLKSGKIGNSYEFETIEPFGFFRCKVYKANKKNEIVAKGPVLGVVRYKMLNTVFEIAFSNPTSGKNNILIEDTADYNNLDKGCLNRVTSVSTYCGMERTHTLKEVYEGKDFNGVSIIKEEIRFENINMPITKGIDAGEEKSTEEKKEKDPSIKIPVIIRYGVTSGNAVAVVIIDIDDEQLKKNEDEIKDAKDKKFNEEVAIIQNTIDKANEEIKILKKLNED